MNFDYSLEPGLVLNKKVEVVNKIEPQITIITPFYNTKKEILEKTANSILNQTYPYFEWLIIDDGSHDKESLEGLNQISKMDDRIKIMHKENQGLAQTRDYGARKACESSKYLLFIDDDDELSSTFVERAYWTLETNPKATWAYGDSVGFGEQQYIWRKWYNPIRQKKENRLVALNFIRKKDFFEAGGYELKEKGVYEDWNFWLKLIAMQKFPVRMSSLDFWYRRKSITNGELAKARANNEKAMEYINKTAKTITKVKKAIQYPKQDYNWDIIEDEIQEIKVPLLQKNGKKKILMIIPWMITGGADKFNYDLIKRIDKNKYEFIIISTVPSENERKQKFEQYATVYDLTSFLDRKYWISFINYIIKKNNIDLIFNTCSQFGYNALPYLKAKYPKIPIIDYIHMEEWYWRNGGYSRDSYAFKDVIDKTLVCNKNSEEILKSHFNKNENEVETVYIGIDEKSFNPEKYDKEEILKKLNIQNKNKYIFSYICRIANQKRPYLLLEIVYMLKQKRDDFLVVVAGDGPMFSKMQAKAKKLKIAENIAFLGNYKNTQEIYAISDLTINCSIKEGVALTSYESLAMGVPVVSSDVGGQKELIDSSVGKIVRCYQDETQIDDYNYQKEEIQQYVVAIEEILENLEKYKMNCRNRIVEKFSINNMVNKMENIFSEVINNPNQAKIENGLSLTKLGNLPKEFITLHLMNSATEYEWYSREFNLKNVGRDYEFDTEDEKKAYYEQTLEYKIKHPIVVVLQKLGVYETCKKLIGKK